MNPTVDSASSRVPARRPGDFHLLAQMKVTKAKGLNTHSCREDGGFTDALFEAPWASAGFLLVPSSLRNFIGRKSPMVHGGRSCDRRGRLLRLDKKRDRAGSLDRVGSSVGSGHLTEPASRPTWAAQVSRVTRARVLDADRSQFEPPEIRRREAASHAKRNRFSSLGLSKSGALTQQMSGQMCIEALCFGDFHLCQQMKVTRPPGRDPATPGRENRR